MIVAVVVVVMVAAFSTPPARAQTHPVGIAIQADDGRGRAVTPGRPCDDGGTGAYWHHEYGADLAPGAFSALASEALVHVDVHSDTQDVQNVDGVYPDGAQPTGFLQGAESHASLLNERGSVKLRLASGSCEAPTLAFDGSVAQGNGTWVVDAGTGAYRDITGSGAFAMTAEVDPGADNALDLDLDGSFTVPDPTLGVSVIRTYWGGLGTDYLSRRVTVRYRITNTGPGDAFGAVLTQIQSQTAGVTPMRAGPIPIGDLPVGETVDLTMRHEMSLLSGPCRLVILNCAFQTRFTVNLPDALDAPSSQSATVTATAPALPPPA